MTPPNLEILAYEETSLGILFLRRRELLSDPGTFVTEVTLNHEFLMSSFNTDSERVISNRSVENHGGENLKALVGGLGLGYTAQELLCHRNVASVDVIEYLPPVIDWLRNGLVPLSETLNAADNLKIHVGDIYGRLFAEPTETFDLIVIDVDHSPEDQLGNSDRNFYQAAGLEKAKRHLNEHGVLAVWSYAEDAIFDAALRTTFRNVQVQQVTTMNSLVNHEQTDWLYFGTK